MDEQAELKEIKALKNAKLRTYRAETFKKLWTKEEDYESKRERTVNGKFIAVYSLWHKRLLARVFYLEEAFSHKKLIRKIYEVQRQLAGLSIKLSQRLYNGYGFDGITVWTGKDNYGWQTVPSTSKKIYGKADGWTETVYRDFVCYNDPFKYLKQSVHKYSAYEYLPSDKQEHNHMFAYLIKYEKHPQLEMLIKMGIPQVIDNLSGIRWSKKGIAMLGITHEELHYLKCGMNLQEYKSIRDWCVKYKFNNEEAKIALRFYKRKNGKPNRKLNLEFCPKMIRYIASKYISLDYYEDMIRLKNELGLPDEDKYLYPYNPARMHDELYKRKKILTSKEVTTRIMRRKKSLERYMMEKDGILIRPLLTHEEFIEEGKEMNHCVGGYAESVANGETAIYTIRKLENANKPVATLELDKKQVVQVRGFHNRMPDDDVIDFVRKWERKYNLEGY